MADVEGAFRKKGIIPDCLDVSPTSILTVKYPNEININLGNLISPAQSQREPELVEWDSDPNKFYTLSMIDPDALSRRFHFLREVNHWLVVNIPGTRISEGEVIRRYMGPGPPPGSGIHRYIFLVYEQPDKLDFARSAEYFRFSIRNYAKEYKLGEPIAGNFFLSQRKIFN